MLSALTFKESLFTGALDGSGGKGILQGTHPFSSLPFARPCSGATIDAMVHLHDAGYKYLFSHADLVRELLEVFAPPGLSELLDYGTLRPETGNFITPAMKKREDDVVWSIELKGQRIYLYLLLEFQASIDKGMPVRMMQYVAALYDHLVRSKTVDPADGLPPVLPIVIYNGDTRWKHSPEVFDLIQPHPAVLTEFQPKLKFWLLDEGRFSAEYLEGLQRVMAAIFRMEHTHDTDDAKRAIRYLGQAVAQSPFKQTIDRAVMQWMQYRLSRKMPGLPLPELDDMLKGTEMLETNIDQWKAKAVAEGLQIGKLEGEARALQRLLSQRFGTIPMAIGERIAAADLAQVEAWFDAALTAPDMASVFAPTAN
jgi:predicted transposase/invertase (TIGR01784 family)